MLYSKALSTAGVRQRSQWWHNPETGILKLPLSSRPDPAAYSGRKNRAMGMVSATLFLTPSGHTNVQAQKYSIARDCTGGRA